MPSIKLFLTISIIAIITLVNFVSSLRGYRESMAEADLLFNDQLMEYALLVSAILPASPNATGKTGAATQDEFPTQWSRLQSGLNEVQSNLVFQVFDSGGEPLVTFNTDAITPVAQLQPGYADVNFDGYRWRALSYQDVANDRWIITAQRDDIRYTLAERVILESILPIVLGIPVAGLLVWVLISLGMRPIRQLAADLQRKEASDLSPLENADLPRELSPLQVSTNQLLRRLQASFDREKRFAADAAHELRTPISVLKVQVHNLINELDHHDGTLQQLKSGVDRMGHLVEQILDLNKTAPDLYAAEFEQLDLHELCREAIRDTYTQFEGKRQQVELTGNACSTRGDRFALLVLLKNLLSNASKYTPEGGNVKLFTGLQNGRPVLSVCDDGPGIPTEDRERVWERFYRLGGDRHATGTAGCGLGLAIVKHIVDLHSADIDLGEPPQGSGLCVTITFNNGEALA